MLHSKMQKALHYVQHWCTSKGLRVNPDKYLGIWLDKKLSWKKDIAMQTNKVTMTYWACRRMFGRTWGLRPRMVKWIYTAIMIPQLTYAAVVWRSALNKACYRKAVDRVGRLAMLGITGALRTTPSSALEALLFMQPPHLIITAEATKAAARLGLQGTWKGARNGHASVLRADSELEGMGGNPSGKDADWAPPRGLVWYTDGSRASGRTGAGVWSEGPAIARAIGLDSDATVRQTELAALRTCARMILERGDKGKKIFIYSDSRRALRAILNGLDSGPRWQLTKNGSRRALQGEVEHVGVHTHFVKDLVRERGDRRIVDRWDSETVARHTKSLLEKPTRKIAVTLLSLNTAKLRVIVGLITGQWHLALFGLTEEDPLHLCTICSGLDEARWDVFGSACKDRLVDRDGIKGLYELARRAQILETSD
ncbi:uncharacterized protein LOC135169362 [Diachasmimorpha longicaudata]|uniref:uncharacterized protein LOC135169362 n=1 Tax=Diachasmimorpha longicaudata TaxID=58733 RepID=UPI0030B8BE65